MAKTVDEFLASSAPLIPVESVSPFGPVPFHTITGSPTPQPANARLAMWNRLTTLPNPVGSLFNKRPNTLTTP